jgi:sugar phosphate isomerase/epimerase
MDHPTNVRWTARDFLSRSGQLGVDAVSLQTAFLPELDGETIELLTHQLHELKLETVLAWGHPSGLEGGTNPRKVEDLSRVLLSAKTLGSSLVRLTAGDLTYYKVSAEKRIETLTPTLKKVAALASEHGLTLAIENHGDFAMKDLVALVERVNMTNFGICFDGMNAVRVGDDLMEAIALAAPHVRMVHIRDFLPFSESPAGVEDFWPSVPLGHGRLDTEGLIHFLETYGYEGKLFVEMAYMHPDYGDEDAAVAESVAYLKGRLKKKVKPTVKR